MKKLLVLAIVLRLLLAGIYFHPDIKTFNYQSSFLKHGVINIYNYLIENKKSLPLKDDFVYFPLTYLTLGGYQAIISPIMGGGIDKWLADASVNSVVRDPNIFKYLIFLKLPYLVLDIAIAFLIKKFFDPPAGRAGDEKLGEKAATIWLFNPFTIVLIYVYSNIDIFPVFLTVLALLNMKNNKNFLASVFLGLAAGFKLYPLLFIPFLFIKGRNLKESFLLSLTPLSIFVLICLPFLSGNFVQSALVSGLTTRIFYPGFNIGFNESIIVGLILIAGIFFYGYFVDKNISLFKYWLAIFVILFSFSHYNIQWLLWIAPFIVILIVKIPRLAWAVFWLSTIAFLIPMLFEDRFMTISLLRVYTTWYDLLPTPFTIVQRVYDPYNLQSIMHTFLAAGGVFTTFMMFKDIKEEK